MNCQGQRRPENVWGPGFTLAHLVKGNSSNCLPGKSQKGHFPLPNLATSLREDVEKWHGAKAFKDLSIDWMHGTKMYKVSLNLCAWWGQGVYTVLSNKQPTQHLKACFCRTHKFWVGKWKDEWPAVVHVWRLQRDLPWSDHWLHWRYLTLAVLLAAVWAQTVAKTRGKENPPETGEGEAGCGSGFWRGRGWGTAKA